ncbi:Transposase [Rhodococcus sp. AW25M09]|uniref:IS21 family transposase n=1 Tax=Rhodococcus sp. AW25M09 TaxID=1268303 RepID=UPI0002AD0766|nr:IS21 family transposase [Rhodococcus sp. AW25M09]CCQ18483.1 Transposase [Rhodococcus sp. AW25M09]
MFDLIELYVHWHAGRSRRQLAESLGIDRKTIAKYLAPAIEEKLIPDSEPVSDSQWALNVARWFPEINDRSLRASTWPVIEPHRQRIIDWRGADVTVATIAQRLRDDHSVDASESSVRRWVTGNLSEDAMRSSVTVPRGPIEPGSEAQIDYGKLGMWFDPDSGRRVAVWAFVMVLACSRHMFVQPVLKMHQSSWCASHVAAFEYFGGVPARAVPDNLKTGVERPDLYDPKINQAYAELAAHYQLLVDPARARKPKDKPRVERPMQYVRDSFWRGREFTSLGQMQTDAVRWCSEVAGLRNSRALDGGSPLKVFQAIEQPALIALPQNAFQLAVWSSGKVATDCHVKVGRALYSVPWRLLGSDVHARTSGDIVQIVHDGTAVATHVLRLSGRSTDFEHYPPEKIAFHMRTPAWCRKTAFEVGPSCVEVIAGFMEINAIHRLRSAQGVLALRTDAGNTRLDAACARALAVGDPSYRTIKGILAAGTETTTSDSPASASAQLTPAFLRGPDQFDTDTGTVDTALGL